MKCTTGAPEGKRARPDGPYRRSEAGRKAERKRQREWSARTAVLACVPFQCSVTHPIIDMADTDETTVAMEEETTGVDAPPADAPGAAEEATEAGGAPADEGDAMQEDVPEGPEAAEGGGSLEDVLAFIRKVT